MRGGERDRDLRRWDLAAVNPAPAVAEVLAPPELAEMQPDFERGFTRFVEVLFAGLVNRESPAPRQVLRSRRG
jgi:hypothetical protein